MAVNLLADLSNRVATCHQRRDDPIRDVTDGHLGREPSASQSFGLVTQSDGGRPPQTKYNETTRVS